MEGMFISLLGGLSGILIRVIGANAFSLATSQSMDAMFQLVFAIVSIGLGIGVALIVG